MTRAKRKQAETRDGMIVTTIALREDVHRQLSIAAIEEHSVMTELVRQAVNEWLARRGKPKTASRAKSKRN